MVFLPSRIHKEIAGDYMSGNPNMNYMASITSVEASATFNIVDNNFVV